MVFGEVLRASLCMSGRCGVDTNALKNASFLMTSEKSRRDKAPWSVLYRLSAQTERLGNVEGMSPAVKYSRPHVEQAATGPREGRPTCCGDDSTHYSQQTNRLLFSDDDDADPESKVLKWTDQDLLTLTHTILSKIQAHNVIMRKTEKHTFQID